MKNNVIATRGYEKFSFLIIKQILEENLLGLGLIKSMGSVG